MRTLELFTRIASQSEGEGADELFKADFAVAVSVKDAEKVFRELTRVTIGEDPLVKVPELLSVESAVWIVSQELVVPVCASALVDRGQRERRMSMKDGIRLGRDACQELSSSWLTGGKWFSAVL